MENLVLEGVLTHDVTYHEIDELRLDGESLSWLVSDLGNGFTTEEDGGYYSSTSYGKVRITIERLEDD